MASQDYVLATGKAAIDRLQLLDQIFGAATRDLLTEVGLERAKRVADIGCGTALVATWMAERLGGRGSVVAIDASVDQLEIGRASSRQLGLNNISFNQATAYETGLERESFDIVYSRFLTCHLTRPRDGLAEMCALVKPGGVLVCEDYDAASVASDPPTNAYERLHEIGAALDRAHGVDSEIGPKMHRMFASLPLTTPRVTFRQAAFLIGPEKRFWELTLREAAPAIVQGGVVTAEELDEICSEMASIAHDAGKLVIIGRVCQTWAFKRKDYSNESAARERQLV